MQKRIEKTIQALLNRKCLYGNRVLVITGYRIDEEKGRTYLDIDGERNKMDRLTVDIFSLLKNFKPIEEDNVLQVQEINTKNKVEQINQDADYFKEILKKNIERIQNNPDYIPQASAIYNQITGYVNITKMQLDIIRTVDKINKK